MDETKLTVIDVPELGAIEPSRADAIRKTFEPMSVMLSEFESVYNDIMKEKEEGITTELAARAKRLRIDIVKVRTGADKIHKIEKAEYLRGGKAVDGVRNLLKWAVESKEADLKLIENHFKIEEQKRLDALQTMRVGMLSEYVEDAQERRLYDMDLDVWNAYLGAKKKAHEDRLQAEKLAEEKRIADEKAEAEERARVKSENTRLKKEAEKREAAAKVERERMAAELEAERKASAAREAAAQRKRDEQASLERKARLEEEERQRKIRVKQEAETKAERERVEAREAAIAEQQRVIDEQNERKRLDEAAKEKERNNKKLQESRRNAALAALQEMDKNNELTPELILETIMDGDIPWVKYEG